MTLPAVLSCCLALLLQQPGAPPPHTITADMRREDVRLEQRITVSAARIQIGDLLERVSKATGVSIRAEEKDGASDPEVSVFLRGLPVADAMDSLWSLVSYKDAEWRWEREGKPGAYTYALTRPLSAQRLGERIAARIQQDFEDEADAYRSAQALSPEQQKAVLRGQQNVTVPLDQLGPHGKALVKMVWDEGAHYKINPVDGSTSPQPDPDRVTFMCPWAESHVAPALFINIPGAGAYAYMGAVPADRAAITYIDDLWLMPGDHKTNTLDDASIPANAKPVDGAVPDERSLDGRLRRLSRLTGVSIIARVPDDRSRERTSWTAREERVLLDILRNMPDLLPPIRWKWRGSTLLVANAAWYMESATDVPWPFVRGLLRSQGEHDGFLTLDDLVAAADKLSGRQILKLMGKFPVLGIASANRWLLASIARSSNLRVDLQSKRGSGLANLLPGGAASGPETADAINHGAEYVRLKVTTKPTGRMFMFTYLRRDGSLVSGGGGEAKTYLRPEGEGITVAPAP